MPDVNEAPQEYVVDTSAVLALLWNEPGADMVANVLERSSISAVNWSELVAVMTERGLPDEAIRNSLSALPVAAVVPFDGDHAEAAGRLRRSTRQAGLSLGDRACLALGLERGLPILTADRAWRDLNVGADIRMIR